MADEPETIVTEETPAELTPAEAITAPVVEDPDAVTEPASPEAKTEEKPEGNSQTPETYELSLPENALIPDTRLAAVEEYARGAGLSNENAQSLVDMSNQVAIETTEALKADLARESNEWAAQVKSDPDMGGTNFDATVVNAQKALARFGSQELNDALKSTGLGNNPFVVRFLSGIGKALGEGGNVDGDSVATAKSGPDLFYPDM